jgi:adenosylcobinamide-GDP ribazoletransferase
MGLFAGVYFVGCSFLMSYLLGFVNWIFHFPTGFLLKLAPAAMTVAFLLVLTGLQHFDGLVDLGNAIGFGKVEDRRAVTHAWIVTYKGAFLAIFVEFLAFLGLVFVNADFAFKAIIAAEVSAKLAMVTITWIGKPAHKGLGALFIEKAKKNRNVAAYVISGLIVVPLLGLMGLAVILASVLVGVFMERVGKSVLGGVSGDMIGATNESARALTLVLLAGLLML